MLPVSVVLITAILYLLIVFSIAARGEKRAHGDRPQPWRYTLALGVHCTTWAFYGTVTQTVHYGWWFAPTYLGGILFFLFAHRLMLHILTVVKQQNFTSIADLIGARYGKSQFVSAFVALIALVALVPYIALQLRAITASFAAITGVDAEQAPWFVDVSAGVALVMMVFAILFGARKLSLSEKHPGLMDAVAFESVVKLVAFMLIGLFCVYQLFDGFADVLIAAAANTVTQEILGGKPQGLYIYLTHMLLGALAMLVLPRQFQVNFIENNHADELKTARWGFPLYLFAINFFILPIALVGGLLVPEQRFDDMFVLAIPVLTERPDISLIAFVGGLAAATSMVMMATLALSIMMSNDVFTPLWLRFNKLRVQELKLSADGVLNIRRLTIILIIVLAYLYHEATESGVPLVSNGLIAMALLAQLGPALIGGMVWQKGSRAGGIAALSAGTLLWTILLLIPSLRPSTSLTDIAISHSVLISLGVNLLLYIVVSRLWPDSAPVQRQAGRFVNPDQQDIAGAQARHVTWGRLRSVLARFIDDREVRRLDDRLGMTIAVAPADSWVPAAVLQRIERELAGAVGSAASHLILHSLARKSPVSVDTVADWASEATKLYRFNRELLQASVENIPQGISVIDKDLRLVAWNRRYLEIFEYPDGFIHAGMPVVELLRFNAERGLFGQPDTDIQREINKRLSYLRQGSSYRYQRKQHDGQIIELQGSPMPDGGFVTTYTDITELVTAQDELQRINQELEQRVAERTRELTDTNQQLQQAKRAEEEAHQSKSRFFAAAGHDLMQPFNAASLFCEMLQQRLAQANLPDDHELARQIQQSLNHAETLLTMLLEMTKLDSGTLKPEFSVVPLNDILRPLQESFKVMAHEQGLEFRVRPSRALIRTDKRLLIRVIQNLLANAIRYTEKGRVLCGVRRRSARLIELQIWDTGIGIPADKQTEIFKEFHQLHQQSEHPGLGLGLAIVERMCRLLAIPVTVRSEEGRGTCFSLQLPVSGWQQGQQTAEASSELLNNQRILAGKRVLVLDNEASLREAIGKLLQQWGADVVLCHSPADALSVTDKADLLVVDYHLDNQETGIAAIVALREHWQKHIPAILITADPDEGIREEVVQVGAMFLPKPLKQAPLLRILKRLWPQM
ncbi:PAS domain-containing hybrid sensor histidine kinase/response regulator [Aliidiomarina haloalkalitolerans]|uniref:histidine kinase n=1 Tax=Aliidiomarina haloalkalitolerans TaxID=859059 RepID=A0A432VR99_9GAMM|nr:PAS domain-containing hybrid sensor histidine kinase/response regulator [Aliidiomarina haloalkalitolerans]RUO18842.1 sodium:proline symporter [Aliidiomarina haloalkalitolerans]